MVMKNKHKQKKHVTGWWLLLTPMKNMSWDDEIPN
jgi:hypothetical protein